ncbi:MAG: alpha/beta hydrolase [Balneolaceae bacterium]
MTKRIFLDDSRNAEAILYYKTYKKGDDRDWVVFVHGAGGSSSIWFKQIKAYRDHFNVLFIDLRGHGNSRHMIQEYYREKYTFQLVSRDVLQVLDHLQIHKAHFIGVSLGTVIIRTIEEIAGERVISTIMCGAIMRLNIRSRVLVWLGHWFKRLVPFLWLYRLFAWIIQPRANHAESRNLFVREAKKMARKEFLKWYRMTYEVNPLLRHFREEESGNPTLYIMGGEDHMFLPVVQKLVEKHRNSELVVIENCGHVCNIEQPNRFNEISIEFLKKHSRAAIADSALTDS